MSRRVLVTTVALVAAVLAIAAITGIPRGTDRPIVITAQFEDALGLYEGNSVSVLGMPVGHVSRITPKGAYVEVEMSIDKGVEVPADVQAVTVSTSILTDRHVELTPPYRGGPTIRTGDVLSLGRTRTPVEFDKTLAMVDKLASALRGDGEGGGPLADLVGVGSDIATGNGEDIKVTLDQLSQALRLGADNGAGTGESIQAIVRSLDELSRSAVDNDAAIREFGSNIHALSDVLAAENLGSGTTGAKVNDILAHATSILESNRDTLKSSASDLEMLTTAIVDNRRELAELFDVAPLTVDNIANAIDPNAGAIRVHPLADKVLADSQLGKEFCNLMGLKQLGCASGTPRDYGPDFGVIGMLELMAGAR